jgi:hypothetical protein
MTDNSRRIKPKSTILTSHEKLIVAYVELSGISSPKLLSDTLHIPLDTARTWMRRVRSKGFNGTSSDELVGSCEVVQLNPASSIEPVQPRAPARNVSPTETNNTLRKGKAASQKDAFRFLNPYEAQSDYQLDSDGIPILLNGKRSEWIEKFGSEAELDTALLESAKNVNPSSPRPLGAQISGELANKLRLKTEREKDRQARAKQSRQPRKTDAELADDKFHENIQGKYKPGQFPSRFPTQ